MSRIVAHVTTFVLHHDAEFGLLLRDQAHSAWAFLATQHAREMIASLVSIDDVGVVVYKVRALASCHVAKVELDRV